MAIKFWQAANGKYLIYIKFIFQIFLHYRIIVIFFFFSLYFFVRILNNFIEEIVISIIYT